jgi:hypothetical protein
VTAAILDSFYSLRPRTERGANFAAVAGCGSNTSTAGANPPISGAAQRAFPEIFEASRNGKTKMPVELPNVRKLFIPDPGYMIFDADLSGADAQVVAWEAEDEDLKKAFRAGMKVHAKNAEDIFGDEYRLAPGDRGNKSTPKGKLYDQCKRSIHLTNYGGTPTTMNRTPEIGWPIARCQRFQSTWFRLHPDIHEWQQRVAYELKMSRKAENRFGYRIIYFDRIDGLLPEALAWIPQSTVALVTFKGAKKLQAEMPFAEVLLQVHDSLVFQIPFRHADNFDAIRKALSIEIPYRDPLRIPWGLARSEKSWGDCKDVAEIEKAA